VQVRLPSFVRKIGGLFFLWGDRPVWRRGRYTVRRLDLLVAAGGVFCTGWYGWTGGWLGALAGALLYAMVVMIALWFL
jgi:hypothetical protein